MCCIRLQFADANSDKGENLEEVAYTMVCPSPDLYKDLHCDMVIPKLTTKLLEDYLQPMGKKLGDTDKNMYSEKYLSFVRICNKGRKTYIHAECHAEMKKSVAYKLDIILESDGVISECQCECTVGSGPSAHCKHVCACLYGLCLFGDGKPIITQETCTQKLQTFHVAKKHTGTPVKAHNLPLSHVNERIRYDPRPPKFRREEGSFDRIRNLCINYASSFSASLPMLQLCPPANMLGICHDHDYFQLTAEDHFLHRHHIISISDSDIAAIEQRTRGQCGNKNWLQERCYRLQASNFGRICKATERTDFRKLAASLTEVNEFSSLATDHGKKSESAAIAKYEELKRTTVAKSGIVVSKQKPYLACSPDGLVHDDLLVEVKCPYSARNQLISSNSVPYLLKDANGAYCLQVGHDYFYQIQGQMFVTQRHRCHLVVYTLVDCCIVEVKYDRDFIEAMLGKLDVFFEKHFRPALLERFLYKHYDQYSFVY